MYRNLALFIIIFSCTCFFYTSIPVWGEYYRYTDSEGVLHFTDNLEDVPEDQRKSTDRFEEIKSQKNIQEEPSPQNPVPGEGEEKGGKTEDEDRTKIKELNDWKQKLDKRYNQLLKKQKAIEEERNNAKTMEEIKTVNEKTKAVNKEVDEYDKDRTAYEKELKAFNQGASK